MNVLRSVRDTDTISGKECNCLLLTAGPRVYKKAGNGGGAPR